MRSIGRDTGHILSPFQKILLSMDYDTYGSMKIICAYGIIFHVNDLINREHEVTYLFARFNDMRA